MGVRLNGASGADVRFRIVSGDDDKVFKAEQRSVGDFVFLFVRTKSGNTVLNRERKDRFVLVVVAATGPSLHAEHNATLNVQVLDANDLSPLFHATRYEATVPEDKALYEEITRVCAEDADLGLSGDIYYSFAERTERFSIDPKSGAVGLTERLDYSAKSFHLLNVFARDRGTVFKGGGNPVRTTLVLTVKRVNLYGPQIYARVLQSSVDDRAGEILALVRVSDEDVGVHGEISSLDIIDGDERANFIVSKLKETDNFTEFNLILSKQSQLRDGTFDLTLRAVDRGFPPRQTFKSVTLRIPRLKEDVYLVDTQEYKVDLPEQVPIQTQVIKLKTESSTESRFEITRGDSDNCFRIDSKTGTIYTVGELDAERRANYALTVSIENAERRAFSVEVKINVIDYNDNAPRFEEIEEMYVEENQRPGTAVGRVRAADTDSKENALIVYSLANANSVPFEIDPHTGDLRTLLVLDYETMSREFSLRVRASDSGLPYRRETERSVRITLRNANDNAPKFLRHNCRLYVPKTTRRNTALVAMTATDPDRDDVLTYSIVSGNNDSCFDVGARTGLIASKCDFLETNVNERYIAVSANDGVHSTETRLRVIVSNTIQTTIKYTCEEHNETSMPAANGTNAFPDTSEYTLNVNAHAPKFIDCPIEMTLNETIETDTIVWRIAASDDDAGYNGELVYSLSGDAGIFKIDFDSGNLRVIERLDYESKRAHLLNITVQDLGRPKRSAFQLLTVRVRDVNDNKPIFETKDRSTVRVADNLKIGATVFVAEASDADSGDAVVYSLTFDYDFLRIDKTTGVVAVTEALAERCGEYDATIRASDSNGAALSLYSELSLRLIIDSVNRKPPRFPIDGQEVVLPEDIPAGSVVAIMTTIESGVTYTLSDTSSFTIDQATGVVRVASALNYRAKRFHPLTVRAVDSAGLSAAADLHVSLVSVNGNLYPPLFEDPVLEATVPENAAAGTTVATVKATDADAPGDDSRVGYTLRSGDALGFFDIDEQGECWFFFFFSILACGKRYDFQFYLMINKRFIFIFKTNESFVFLIAI